MSTGRRNDPADIALKTALGTLAALALVLLLAPTVIVLVVSFTDSYSLRFPPKGFSLRWWGEVFRR